MSQLVCYIERAERGMLPVRIRLISTRTEDVWAFPEVMPDDRAALERGLREAAAWVAERMRAHGHSGLGALVLDTDGSLCSWVSTPGEDPDAIGAMLRHAGNPGSEEDPAHTVGSPPQLAMSSDARLPGGVSVQPLPHAGGAGSSSSTGPARRRLGVMMVPDATVRLLLDELDARGVVVGRSVTLWHALVEAFDQTGGAQHAERVVSEATATTAQVVVDRWSGRLLWAWSRGGVPLAAGAFRIPRVTHGEEMHPTLDRSDLARLASEWIAWSVQLGASPSRVRAVLPDGVWTDEASLGECVSAVWPGATADLTFDDDPVALALVRFADAIDDPRAVGSERPALAPLQGRPGRQHRAMYRWGAVAVALAGAALAVAAYNVHSSATVAKEKASSARTSWRKIAGEIYPIINEGPLARPSADSKAVVDLRSELERRRKETAPVQITPEKPIMAELETLSFVLGNPDYKLDRIDLTSSVVIINVTVPDTAAYEELIESINLISGSSIFRWDKNPRPVVGQPGMIQVQLTGLWSEPPRVGGGGQS